MQPTWQTSGVRFIGTATSHFQSEPFNPTGYNASDWEWEIDKKLRSLPSGVTAPIEADKLPHLLRNGELYARRSQELGCNMYRLSFDLPRLAPRDGSFDERLMEQYVRFLATLRAAGHEPMVTLHHFTMPKYLVSYGTDGLWPVRGAWQHPEVLRYFRKTIERVVSYLGDRQKLKVALTGTGLAPAQLDECVEEGLVRWFMPINEPGVTFGNGYLGGNFPPFKKGRLDLVVDTLNTMVEAHSIMTDRLRDLGHFFPKRPPMVGLGYNWQYFEGWGSSLLHAIDHHYTDAFEEKVRSDFLGLHYYCRLSTHLGGPAQAEREMSEHPLFGDVYPQGVRKLLGSMSGRYPGKPIFVSEIGFSEAMDRRRPYWILETVKCILEAQREGAPILGVLLWSLADNFEWDSAMTQHFGLFSEEELSRPLAPDEGVCSWQAWAAVAELLLKPSGEAEAKIDQLYSRAKMQWAAYHATARH